MKSNPNMACDICGDSTDTFWFHGVCRCRNDAACMKRAPWAWERVKADREPVDMSKALVDFFQAISNHFSNG